MTAGSSAFLCCLHAYIHTYIHTAVLRASKYIDTYTDVCMMMWISAYLRLDVMYGMYVMPQASHHHHHIIIIITKNNYICSAFVVVNLPTYLPTPLLNAFILPPIILMLFHQSLTIIIIIIIIIMKCPYVVV